ncbi:MAG TPA: 3'(2'),5'-bisphosphate nucleotidase CysQ, partial [Dehalococcoidia bacterium]|nr:3'(2'),5'-bisphosphate nucleotidase CysQ [Dehalococcoidia bacterium]
MPTNQTLMSSSERSELISEMLRLAIAAGDVILEIYRQDFAIEIKKDASPVTEADKLAEEIIMTGLRNLNLNYEIIA